MLLNRPEFHIADLAVMTLGATPFSIYATYTREQIEYVTGDAGAKVALIEAAFAERFPELEHVLVLEDGWPEVEGFDSEPHWRAIGPDDEITLIYTSGTTGPPKGVQLVHRNLMTAVQSVEALIQFPEGSRVISWLPAAHIAERMAHHYLPIVYAMTITCCPNPREVVGYLPAVKPTWFFAVPRIWEKLKAGLEGPRDARRERRAARRRGAQGRTGAEVGKRCPPTWRRSSTRPIASSSPGCGRCSGSTRRSPSTWARRRRPARSWSSSTPSASPSPSCGACPRPAARAAATRRARSRSAPSARPDRASSCKLGEDGELLMRSGVVMTGYRNAPDKTAEALDADGWLHTGDIAEIDEDGYVRIVDRKKEIIINAAGKNMSPANIESTLKGASP